MCIFKNRLNPSLFGYYVLAAHTQTQSTRIKSHFKVAKSVKGVNYLPYTKTVSCANINSTVWPPFAPIYFKLNLICSKSLTNADDFSIRVLCKIFFSFAKGSKLHRHTNCVWCDAHIYNVCATAQLRCSLSDGEFQWFDKSWIIIRCGSRKYQKNRFSFLVSSVSHLYFVNFSLPLSIRYI